MLQVELPLVLDGGLGLIVHSRLRQESLRLIVQKDNNVEYIRTLEGDSVSASYGSVWFHLNHQTHISLLHRYSTYSTSIYVS